MEPAITEGVSRFWGGVGLPRFDQTGSMQGAWPNRRPPVRFVGIGKLSPYQAVVDRSQGGRVNDPAGLFSPTWVIGPDAASLTRRLHEHKAKIYPGTETWARINGRDWVRTTS